jgi:hypothetical protein
MLDFAAYISSQYRTSTLAHSALPDAPVQQHVAPRRLALPRPELRLRMSLALRRLADAIEPACGAHEPAAPGYG